MKVFLLHQAFYLRRKKPFIKAHKCITLSVFQNFNFARLSLHSKKLKKKIKLLRSTENFSTRFIVLNKNVILIFILIECFPYNNIQTLMII